MIKSSRHVVKFHLALIDMISFFLVMTIFIFMVHFSELSTGGEIGMMLMGLACVCGAVYILIRYIKNATTIQIDNESITVNDQTYLWSDLEKAQMTGKQRFRALNGGSKEATTLYFKDKKEVHFFDDMYSNSPEMKRFIDRVIIKKQPLEAASSVVVIRSGVVNEPFVYFKGYQLLCADGILFWLFLIPTLCLVVWSVIALEVGGMIASTLMVFYWYLLFGSHLSYFGVSDHYFSIRIHNFFWIKKNYLISDIKEVIFEPHFKMTTCLRIITNDFESKFYPADSLWSKRWMGLKQALEEKNVKVRNECVSYTPFEFKLYN